MPLHLHSLFSSPLSKLLKMVYFTGTPAGMIKSLLHLSTQTKKDLDTVMHIICSLGKTR